MPILDTSRSLSYYHGEVTNYFESCKKGSDGITQLNTFLKPMQEKKSRTFVNCKSFNSFNII